MMPSKIPSEGVAVCTATRPSDSPAGDELRIISPMCTKLSAHKQTFRQVRRYLI